MVNVGEKRSRSKKSRDLTLDLRKREQASPTGHSMLSRFSTGQSTVAMRRWGPPAVLTLAAMAALTALTADAVANRRAPRHHPRRR